MLACRGRRSRRRTLTASQQIFVRAFKGGAWQTQGFPESLNEDAAQVAQAPSIDFTGANRTVPWVGWAEPSTVLGHDQIFASRFLPQPAPAQGGGQWIHEGQQVTGTAPSLNINTNRDAAAPSLIGGTTNAGANPAPWLTWQEFDGQQGACNTDARARRRSSSPTPSRRRRGRARPAPSRTTARASATSASSRSGSTASRVPAPVSSTRR